MVIKRGEIWWAELQAPAGSGPGYRRPLLIVQSNDFNKSRINTIIAIALTSNLHLADAPGNVLLPKKITRLPKDSVANVSQIITIDKHFLTERIGRLPISIMRGIDAGMRLALSL
ncbi:MAG: type II toxin-antitoxin system PemK/MazF family toxin [Desulfobacterales bacterium]|nr:MAG: type II toxin-antitoxin system PemK/MazF family toxin [Desulfobacterales bacterium]